MSDFSEVVRLAADLRGAGKYVREESRKALHRTSMKVKQGAIRDAKATFDSHARHAQRSIDYDLEATGEGWYSEVGYRDEGGPGVQGFLGAVLEYGGARSPAFPVLGVALYDNIEDLVQGQVAAVEAATRKALG